MFRHPKFKDEKTCKVCSCTFLPEEGYVDTQKHCLNCAVLPELPKETSKEVGIIKICKKCHKEFTPTSSANTICPICKNK